MFPEQYTEYGFWLSFHEYLSLHVSKSMKLWKWIWHYCTAQRATLEMTRLTINVENIRNLKDCWTTCSEVRIPHLLSLRINFYCFRSCYILLANTSTEEVDKKLNTDLTGSKCGLLLAEDAQDGNFTKISCHEKSLNSLYSLKFPDKISSWSFFSCFYMQGQISCSHLANNGTVISTSFLCLNWWRAEDEGWHWQCPFNILIGRSLPPVTHNTQRESYLINNKERKKMKATALCCLSASCKTLLTPARWNKQLHFNHWEEKSMYTEFKWSVQVVLI